MKLEIAQIEYIIDMVESIQENPEYSELVSFFPQGKRLNTFDFLTSLPDLVIAEYPSLFEQSKELKNLFVTFKKKKAEIDLNTYNEKIFNPKEIFNHSSASDELIHDTLEEVDSFIGKIKLQNQLPEFFIYFQKEKIIPYTDGSKIILNYENKTKSASYIIHELGHLIELQNLKLNNECLDFINKNNKFINEYVSTIYKNNGTEVFSTGLQMMYFSPIEFLFKSPTHFYLIYRNIKG